MTKLLIGVLATTLAAFLVIACFPRAQAAPRPRTPVLVELFTSEGCSDCPPADRVLAALQRDQPVPDATIIALAEHVDYWNNTAWTDRFSSGRYSERQQDYVRHFRLDSAYTPEMVVDGRREFVGSDEGAAREAVEAAAILPHANVSESVEGFADNEIRVRLTVKSLPPAGTGPIDIFAAVTEDGLRSVVDGGENGGRTLTHEAVVRVLDPIGTISGPTFEAETQIPVQPGWRPRSLHVVAFAQDRSTGAILGSSISEVN
ncbi:MAG: DUF1223 domain-containing protein [Capsulimonadaceae bacterium]